MATVDQTSAEHARHSVALVVAPPAPESQWIGDLLAQHDVVTVLVATGRDALARLATTVPDLIVAHTRLPDAAPWELCRALRGDDRLSPHAPIVFVGPGTREERLAILREGAWTCCRRRSTSRNWRSS